MKKISLLFLLAVASIHVMAQQVITVNDRMVEEEKKPKMPGKNIIKIKLRCQENEYEGFNKLVLIKYI